MPEEGEKYQPGHWRQEELDVWLKAPGGSGIMQGKPETGDGKVRLIETDKFIDDLNVGVKKLGIPNNKTTTMIYETLVPLKPWPKDPKKKN
jgi:hypothetical protein